MPDMAFTLWIIEFEEKCTCLTSFFSIFRLESPYAKSVKVKVICHGNVVHYRNDKQEDRQLLNAVIADHNQAVKCTSYDVQKFNRFVEGKTIIIRNCIKKTANIVVTTNTKVFPSGNIAVLVAIEREGRIFTLFKDMKLI